MESKILAADLLAYSTHRRGIHLSLLVADTGLWVSPDYYQRLLQDAGSGALFPLVRRARIGQGEARGQFVGDVRLDDNNYANVAIKRALGVSGGMAVGFEACHIWPLTCYDERYHTLVANLLLLPRALAGLSDHDVEIQKALQYRAYELYGWWPEEQSKPARPDFYPDEWREPMPEPIVGRAPGRPRSSSGGVSSERQRSLEDRIRKWASQPGLNAHKIIGIVVNAGERQLTRDELVRTAGEVTGSKNAYGAVASLMSNSGNAYGRVFEMEGDWVRLSPEVADLIVSLSWEAR